MNDNQSIQSSFWSNLFKAPTEIEDLESLLAQMPLFSTLKQKYIKQIITLMHNRVYQPNEYIFKQDDPGIGLFIIREGNAIISYKDENGKLFQLASFQRGDFFGEMAMLDDQVRSASAIATKESNIAVIFKPDLDEFMANNPKVGNQILLGISKIIATRLRMVNKQYLELMRNNN